MKRALICGISGQDGAYLAEFLLQKSYEVYGTSRDAQISSQEKLIKLGINKKIKMESMSLTDFRSVYAIINKVMPDEIYNLAGQSSVGLSFQQPVETIESISVGVLNILEAIRFINPKIRFYNASSSEVFGNLTDKPADETTIFRPRSPYAVAKAAAFWEVANYREAYGIYACSGILFNHESPLRPERFVTKKIISAACRIALGSSEKLVLGNIDIKRDWGWAPEYVRAMWLMMQEKKPDDFVIATGEYNSLRTYINQAFSSLDLDWNEHVTINKELYRPLDLEKNWGNPGKAKEVLEWSPKYKMNEVVAKMVDSEMKNLDKEAHRK